MISYPFSQKSCHWEVIETKKSLLETNTVSVATFTKTKLRADSETYQKEYSCLLIFSPKLDLISNLAYIPSIGTYNLSPHYVYNSANSFLDVLPALDVAFAFEPSFIPYASLALFVTSFWESHLGFNCCVQRINVVRFDRFFKYIILF